jgi:hypothetical protein
VLLVTKAFDTSWFDLNNYDGLSKFSLREWGRQLSIRSQMWHSIHEPDLYEKVFSIWIETIKTEPLIPNSAIDAGEWKELREHNPACFYSVFSTPAVHFWYALQEDLLSDVWDACRLEDQLEVTEEHSELADTPLDFLVLKRDIGGEELANVVVNVEATDEQILSDFKNWLSAYRKASGCISHEKNFTDKNLADWCRWRLLPYIDLMLIAKASRAEITQNKIARLLFNDEFEIDIVDRLRRTTRPKAEWLIREHTVSAICAQAEAMA